MTFNENLLIVAQEECSEIQQAISKSIRFGLDNYHPDRPHTCNAQELLNEYYQLQSVFEMMFDYGLLPEMSEEDIQKIKLDKLDNVLKYAELSRQIGRITESEA